MWDKRRGTSDWDKKAADKRRGARLQTCRVAIRGDMSLRATPTLVSLPGQILEADPHNRSREHNIKKLEGIARGEGQ